MPPTPITQSELSAKMNEARAQFVAELRRIGMKNKQVGDMEAGFADGMRALLAILKDATVEGL